MLYYCTICNSAICCTTELCCTTVLYCNTKLLYATAVSTLLYYNVLLSHSPILSYCTKLFHTVYYSTVLCNWTYVLLSTTLHYNILCTILYKWTVPFCTSAQLTQLSCSLHNTVLLLFSNSVLNYTIVYTTTIYSITMQFTVLQPARYYNVLMSFSVYQLHKTALYCRWSV